QQRAGLPGAQRPAQLRHGGHVRGRDRDRGRRPGGQPGLPGGRGLDHALAPRRPRPRRGHPGRGRPGTGPAGLGPGGRHRPAAGGRDGGEGRHDGDGRMTVLEIDGVSKTYGAGADAVAAIDEVTLTTRPGELLCIVGPSGCGKTTLLRCVSGLMPPTGGAVRLDDRAVTSPPRSMALVFQDYSRSLLPWMSIHDNVVLPLKAARIAREERERLAADALASVGLADHGRKYPWQLSGGMQQRAAIARALAYQPEILLLDEPFASVDAQTRADLEDLLLDVWTRTGLTVLLVTHDIDEAVYLAS